MLSAKKKALIHVAKARVGMTEPEYRDLLSGHGVESCVQLTQVQFEKVMQQFARLGFAPKATYRKPAEAKRRLTAKVEAIKADLGLTDAYIDAMARRMFRVDAWRWATGPQLYKLVAALTYHQRRVRP